MKESGQEISCRVLAKRPCRTAQFMKENLKIQKRMGKENVFGLMVKFTRDSGSTMSLKAPAIALGQMVEPIRANGRIMKCMVKADMSLMVRSTRVAITWERSMGLECTPGKMAKNMLAIGRMVNSMVRVPTRGVREFGMRAKERSGRMYRM